MKRSPLVKKDAAHLVGYGRQLIHVLEGHETGPGPGAFVGDFLIWQGTQNLYVKNKDGMWVKVDRRMSVYQDVKARLYEEGINLRAGDES